MGRAESRQGDDFLFLATGKLTKVGHMVKESISDRAGAETWRLEPPKVLRRVTVIDDDESVCVALCSLLRSAGYACAVFPSAESFLSSGGLNRSDCLVLDMRMPGMNGLELHGRVRELNPKMPVIYMTACSDEISDQAIRCGAAAIFEKPFNDEKLLHAIGDAVKSLE
jgi:FixJ family two-component response regulator